uniref:cDNA sequence BC030500 n=1 Tax=Cricetulus griseus TaxID=10029 RepID=A0A8C2QKX8_CRIGR
MPSVTRPGTGLSSPKRHQARYSGVKVAQSRRAMGVFLHPSQARQRQRQRAEATQSGLVLERRFPKSAAQARYVVWREEHRGEQRQLPWSLPAPGAQV